MKTVTIPYGDNKIDFLLPDESPVILPDLPLVPDCSESQVISHSLKSPISSHMLRDLANGKKRITVIVSDHTRAMPTSRIIKPILTEIRSNNPNAEITILVATGLHRSPTTEELWRILGRDVAEKEHVVINKAYDNNFVNMGVLPSGSPFFLHRAAAECDLLVAIGLIEPHFFAGFSGGPKSVLPGVCSAITISANHSYHAINDPLSSNGVLRGNIIHQDMLEASHIAKLAYIINVIVDSEKNILACFSGDPNLAHKAGTEFLMRHFRCTPIKADIVITSNGGYPLDQNLYQTPKSTSSAASCCRDGGVIILVAECRDGFGSENFKRIMEMGTPNEIDHFLSCIPDFETISDQWSAQIYSRILRRCKLILISSIDSNKVSRANLIPASSAEEALFKARKIVGDAAKIVAIPDGASTIILEACQ